MTFAWGSDNPEYRKLELETLQQRYQAENFQTNYYNPEIHKAAFALPQYIVRALNGTDSQ